MEGANPELQLSFCGQDGGRGRDTNAKRARDKLELDDGDENRDEH